MLRLAEDGGLDVILTYSASRLTRHVRELLDLSVLSKRRKIAMRTMASGDVYSETEGRMALAGDLVTPLPRSDIGCDALESHTLASQGQH